jgi:ketosteroid isomerase-like protein
MSRENVEIVQRLYEAWNRSGGVPPLEFIDPRIEVEIPGGLVNGGTFRGHAGLTEVLEAFWDYFEEHRIEVEECIPAGDDVVVTVRYYGRGKTSGVAVDMRHWHVWTWCDGKAVRWRVRNTRGEALEAVGLRE